MPNIRRFLLFSIIILFLAACSGQTQTPHTANTEPTHVLIVPSVTPTTGDDFLSRADDRPELTPTQMPTSTATPILERSAMVIVWDGGGADIVYPAMEAGVLPHFSQLAARGVRAEAAQPVDPSLSAPAQTSLVTGVLPGRSGIVSNSFHNANDNFYWYRVGFDEPLDQAEPIWAAASRAGFNTAALFLAGATPELPNQMADYTIGYGVWEAYSSQKQIELTPAEGQNTAVSYSPALGGAFFIPDVAQVKLLVIDSTDDGLVNYDRIILSSNDSRAESMGASNGSIILENGEWGSLVLRSNLTSGADFLIQEISPREIKLFHTGVYHNTAAPRGLLESLNQEFGFFPAGPDDYALEHGWITPDDYMEILERQARWMAEVSAWVYQKYKPDLFFTWQNGFDSAYHSFLLVDPRQAGYTPERAEQYAGYRRRAAEIIDQALATMLHPVDLEQTMVLLTADHGIAPVHTTIYPNTLLERAGLLVLDRRDYVDVKKSKALSVASGGSVNIYINLVGREKDGIVPQQDYPAIQAQIVELLQGLNDPETGSPVFHRVLTRQELGKIGLDHPNSGDIFAQAAIGYSLDDWRGKGEVFAPATVYGSHGYDSSLPEMQAFLMAGGAGFPLEGKTSPSIRLVDLAPILADFMDFELSGRVDGQAIPWLFQP